jgi:hypothetical protein
MKKIQFPPYEPIAVKEDLHDIMMEACEIAYKNGYQRGYRAGRSFENRKLIWEGDMLYNIK